MRGAPDRHDGRRFRGGDLAMLAIALAALLGSVPADAQCCVCSECPQAFCLDAVDGAIACAEMCEQAGCVDITFNSTDTCSGGCEPQTDVATATPSASPSASPTVTPTPEDTATATESATMTLTTSPAGTPSHTPSAVATATNTVTATPETSATATSTDTAGPSPTATDTVAATATATVEGTATATNTAIPTGTATATVTATDTQSPATGTPTATPPGTATKTAVATEAATATATSSATAELTATATATLPPGPTATATAVSTTTATATATATNTPSPAVIAVGDASGGPGSTPGFAVTIDTAGLTVASAGVCIEYDPLTPIAATVGNEPNCTVPAALGKLGTFTFKPDGCTPGSTCHSVCALVGGSASAIASGAQLFSCRVAIAATAALGNYPLLCSAASAGAPDESALPATCTAGTVVVENRLPGDCDGDGKVTVDELIKGVNIALNLQPVTFCPAFDTNFDGQVIVNELVAAVNVALTS